MTDKFSFSQRLQAAIKKSSLKPSPTLLAFEFNTLWRGEPITVNTARKWLLGLSIPTLDKIEVLAILLNVPTDWLQCGGSLEADEDPNSMAKRKVISRLNQLSYEDLLVIDALTKAILELRKPAVAEQTHMEGMIAKTKFVERQDPNATPQPHKF